MQHHLSFPSPSDGLDFDGDSIINARLAVTLQIDRQTRYSSDRISAVYDSADSLRFNSPAIRRVISAHSTTLVGLGSACYTITGLDIDSASIGLSMLA